MTWGWSGDHRGPQERRARQGERSRDARLLHSQLWDAPALPALPQNNTTNPHIDTHPAHLTTHLLLTPSTHQHTLAEQYTTNVGVLYCILSSHLKGPRMQGISAQHLPSPSVLQLHMPDICIIQRQRSYEEEVGNVLNLCLNHIKTALCNFLNDLTRAVPTEMDHALCPNIEPCPPNGRKSKTLYFSSRNIGIVLFS